MNGPARELRGLPEPSKQGLAEDGSWSQVWIRGSQALRIRSKRTVALMNEYEGKTSVRKVHGSPALVFAMAQRWFQSLRD